MASLPVYSSRDVKLAWNGAPLDGLAPDSFITFSRNADLTDEEVGADGQLSVSRLPDRTGTCTISLQQQSTGNSILAGVINLQETSNVFVKGSLTITDPSGSVLAVLGAAHLKTAPEVSLGSSAAGATRDWVFYCESMIFSANTEGSQLIAAAQSFVDSQIAAIAGNV